MMKMTTKQAAEYLGVTIGFVSRVCKKGSLRAEMIGRDWLIDPADLEAFKNKPRGKVGRPKKSG